MEIVTGVGEKPHVTSKKFRRIIESITGQGSYIIGCGDNMSTELVSNNLLKIKSGAMIHHGNVSSVDPYDEIEINNGTQGMKRIDLVVNRYTKNAETEIEKNEWIVIQGAPAASNPAVPEHVVGNLQEGDLVDDCPFCQIYIDGINVTEVKELLTIIPNVPDLVAENAARKKEVAELNSKFAIVEKKYSLSLPENAYVAPYSRFGTLNISDDVVKYGYPISVTASDSRGVAVPVYVSHNGYGIYTLKISGIVESNEATVYFRRALN